VALPFFIFIPAPPGNSHNSFYSTIEVGQLKPVRTSHAVLRIETKLLYCSFKRAKHGSREKAMVRG
jgi:hypothetical protein